MNTLKLLVETFVFERQIKKKVEVVTTHRRLVDRVIFICVGVILCRLRVILVTMRQNEGMNEKMTVNFLND